MRGIRGIRGIARLTSNVNVHGTIPPKKVDRQIPRVDGWVRRHGELTFYLIEVLSDRGCFTLIYIVSVMQVRTSVRCVKICVKKLRNTVAYSRGNEYVKRVTRISIIELSFNDYNAIANEE